MVWGLFQFLSARLKRGPIEAEAPATLPTDDPDNRREDGRRWGDPVEIHVWYHDTPGEKVRALILNRSVGGIGFSLDQCVPEGGAPGNPTNGGDA